MVYGLGSSLGPPGSSGSSWVLLGPLGWRIFKDLTGAARSQEQSGGGDRQEEWPIGDRLRPKMSENVRKFQKMSQNFGKFQKFSENFKKKHKTHQITENFTKFQNISANFR